MLRMLEKSSSASGGILSSGMGSSSLSSMMSTLMSPDFLFCDLGSSIIGKVKLGLLFLLGGFGNLEGFGSPLGLGKPGDVLTPPSMSGDSKHASDDQYLPSLSDQVTSS